MTSERERFINGYIEALLWSEAVMVASDETVTGEHADEHDPSDELTQRMREDAGEFFDSEHALIAKAIDTVEGYTYEHAGHDFALTRNGHGAGFWDRGLGDVGDYLSDAAHMRGEFDIALGEDGLLYPIS